MRLCLFGTLLSLDLDNNERHTTLRVTFLAYLLLMNIMNIAAKKGCNGLTCHQHKNVRPQVGAFRTS